jgi:hypothetical protein
MIPTVPQTVARNHRNQVKTRHLDRSDPPETQCVLQTLKRSRFSACTRPKHASWPSPLRRSGWRSACSRSGALWPMRHLRRMDPGVSACRWRSSPAVTACSGQGSAPCSNASRCCAERARRFLPDASYWHRRPTAMVTSSPQSSPEFPIAFYTQTFRGAAWAGSRDGRRHSPLRPPASATPTVGRVPESGCEGR